MRIVFFASGEFAVPALRWLANSPHEVAAVVTQPARPSGRGRKTVPTPAAECAAQLRMPVIECPDVNELAFVERIRKLNARLGIVIAFGQKIGREIIESLPCGCVNLHGSLLPKYRGAAPIAWAILCGEEKTGVTVFRLVDRMDAGDILVQRETLIGPDETAGELHDRLAMIGPDAIEATLPLFENEDSPAGRPQDERRASIAPKLSKQAGRLDFRRGAIQLARQIRAMSPWPGARCVFRTADRSHEETVTILRARPNEATRAASAHESGCITSTYEVATSQGTVEVLEIQPAGGRPITFKDFVNGRRIKPGDRFETLPTE
jgi:methionyl-tRNA formyltransferase